MKKEEFTTIMREEHGWDPTEIKKIWSFGLEDYIANCLIDKTIGMQHMTDAKSLFVDGFQDVLRSGPLCNEPIRGVQFRITDAKLHPDPIHRGVSQVLPMATKACNAAFLAAEPRLMEPMFLCEISSEEERRSAVYNCISNRRGTVIDDDQDYGSMIKITAHLPVAESFGFAGYLREETQGRAHPMTKFSHWQLIKSDPFEEGSRANKIVKEVRARKGLPAEIPTSEKFADRL